MDIFHHGDICVHLGRYLKYLLAYFEEFVEDILLEDWLLSLMSTLVMGFGPQY
jgi:hypothetical protein